MPARGSPYGWPWPKVRLGVLERDGYVCQIEGPTCKGRATSVDHRIPLSRGGARLDPGNLRAACRSCQTWCSQEARRVLAGKAPWCGPHECPAEQCGGPHSVRWY